MAFQTSLLRDGEWVTETVDIQNVLNTPAAPTVSTQPCAKPPVCGIVSRTVVESPIVHWIVPVHLRSRRKNDVAFVGDDFVQISELQKDGQLHEVVRKTDFGSRISGATVFGSSLQRGLDKEDALDIIKAEEQDLVMRDVAEKAEGSQARQPLPPQLLVLALESGAIIFTFLSERDGLPVKFVLNKYQGPTNLPYLGFHLAVEYSSQYMAAASPDGALMVFELHSMANIRECYHRSGLFDPIKSVRFRTINGVIHKMDFLWPPVENKPSFILVLIVVTRVASARECVSHIVVYDWEADEDLEEVFAEQETGTRLPNEHRLPSLIIPLQFDTSFIIVSQPSLCLVRHCLSGAPSFEEVPFQPIKPTPLYHGLSEPLWTAWSRPFRRKSWFGTTDLVYLAREDGVIIHLAVDGPDPMPAITRLGFVDTNINTAFNSAYDIFSDVLIIGGESSSGGVWKLPPRAEAEQVGILPNWSPVIDFIPVSREPKDQLLLDQRGSATQLSDTDSTFCRPDSLFSASGRGQKGNLTEWRWGMQGRISLDVESGEPLKRSWGFLLEGPDGCDLYGLLALPSTTIALRFAKDLSQVDTGEVSDAGFERSYRTLYASQTQAGLIVQTTERTVALVTGYQTWSYELESILGVTDVRADYAHHENDVLILSSHNDDESTLHTVGLEGTSLHHMRSWQVSGDITCVTLFSISRVQFTIVAFVQEGISYISVFSLDGERLAIEALVKKSGETFWASVELISLAFIDIIYPEDSITEEGVSSVVHPFEPITSLCVARESIDEINFTAGTRCGHLLNIRLTGQRCDVLAWSSEELGVSPVDVFPINQPFEGGTAVMVCCDGNLVMMSRFSEASQTFEARAFVWLTDSNDASLCSPSVHAAFSLSVNLPGQRDHVTLMLLAGSRLLVAEIWPQLKLVPRSLPVGGSPTRVIFSKMWNCFVVALVQDDKPTLAFVDPGTGLQIAAASDRQGNGSDSINGLGKSGDRIFGLSEWLYVKDGKTFAYLLVGTKEGKVLVVSVHETVSQPGDAAARRLRYFTRYRKAFPGAVISIIGDGNGIIYCVDKTLHWDVLDLVEKKLTPKTRYQLDSPATVLRVSDDKLHALTMMHSLEVFDHRTTTGDRMRLLHTDRVARLTYHMVDIGVDVKDSNGNCRPITLLSDQHGGIAGVWIPWEKQDEPHELVFQGSLPHPIRRFIQARTLPPWQRSKPRKRYGVLASSEEGSQVFGVCLDGSLRHFELIDFDLWRFLKFIENLARISSALDYIGVENPNSDSEHDERNENIDVEPQSSPASMVIDGDVINRCLQHRLLEKVVAEVDDLDLLREYLDGLEDGKWTDDFRDSNLAEPAMYAAYFKLGYAVLDHVLAPAL